VCQHIAHRTALSQDGAEPAGFVDQYEGLSEGIIEPSRWAPRIVVTEQTIVDEGQLSQLRRESARPAHPARVRLRAEGDGGEFGSAAAGGSGPEEEGEGLDRRWPRMRR